VLAILALVGPLLTSRATLAIAASVVAALIASRHEAVREAPP
jgi:hypothetical protein